MKRFLDSVAYCLLLGQTKGIETDYKKAKHARREIPASSCPSFIGNMLYASGGVSDQADRDENAWFQEMLEEIDEKTEKHEPVRVRKEFPESRFHKLRRIGIRGGQWCAVDTDGVFEFDGKKYRIDPDAAQYHSVETDLGDLYDMDRVLVVDGMQFYDMNYDAVDAREI